MYSNLLHEGWMSPILDFYHHSEVAGLAALETELPHLEPSTLVLIQGDLSFLTRWTELLPIVLAYLTSSTLGSPPLQQGIWRHLSHVECGGVTSGVWSVGSNCVVVQMASQALNQDLQTILDAAVKHSISTEILDYVQQLPLTLTLLVSKPKEAVVTSSVYTGQCQRALTIMELGRAFDLPSHIARWFKEGESNLPFLQDALTSVLLHFGMQFLSTPPNVNNSHTGNGINCGPITVDGHLISLNQRQEVKATRSNDAKVPVHLWDKRFWSSTTHSALQLSRFIDKMDTAKRRYKYGCDKITPLTILWHWVHSCWVRNIFIDLVKYSRLKFGMNWIWEQQGSVFLDTAINAINPAARSSFWERCDGSTLLFWRWPSTHEHVALLGYPSWVMGDLPCYRVPQQAENSNETRSMVRAKLHTVWHRRYVTPGRVESLTSYFSAPKGDTDGRLVNDASKSGLNSHLWSPSFHLP